MAAFLILGGLVREGLEEMVDEPDGLRKDLKTLAGGGIEVKNHWLTAGHGVDVVLLIEARNLKQALAFATALSAKRKMSTNTLSAVEGNDIDAVLNDAKTKIRRRG